MDATIEAIVNEFDLSKSAEIQSIKHKSDIEF